jgi:hypothetical protein
MFNVHPRRTLRRFTHRTAARGIAGTLGPFRANRISAGISAAALRGRDHRAAQQYRRHNEPSADAIFHGPFLPFGVR